MDFYSSLNKGQLNAKKPTIFEVTLCSQLTKLLSPSLRFLLAHYTHRYPSLLIRILNNFDELNLILRSFIEYQYLKTWNSTFIEKFYGIKRTNTLLIDSFDLDNTAKITNQKRLTSFQILLSLIDSVGVSYIEDKLQLYYDKLVPQYLMNAVEINVTEKEEKKPLSLQVLCVLNKLKKFLKDLFFKYYPLTKLALKIGTLFLNILYLADKTSSTSIIQWLSNISYARITNADHRRMDDLLSGKPKTSELPNIPPNLTSLISHNIKTIAVATRKVAWMTTDTILPVSIFTLKFLEWYNGHRDAQKDDEPSTEVPIVPSIVPMRVLQNEEERSKFVTSTTDESVCRICNDTIHNPAVIETGYVFCYKCIYEYLRDQTKTEGGRCPVSGRKLFGCSWNDLAEEWNVKSIRKLII